MAADLRRMVVLGPIGTIQPGSSHDYRQAGNRRFFAETGTRWVRMWADWPTLMPNASGFAPAIIDSLDEQIALARRDGLRIVLTLYRFPTWANGIDQLSQAQLDATMPDRKASAASPDTSAKSPLFRYPADVSPGSAWGNFVDRIASRYSAGNPNRPSLDATIDVLEIVNEPNLQWWPQQGPSTTADPYGPGPLVVHDVLVRMFATAKAIVARYGNEPMLGGPATADSVGDTRLRTGYGTLTDRLLAALGAASFTGGSRFAWTHHNYTDVTFDQGPGTTAPDAGTTPRTTSFAADVRRRLIANAWAGWPAANPADPWIMLTEGGVTIQSIRSTTRWNIPDSDPARQRAKQAELISRAWDRMASTADGTGIAVASNYLWYTDPNFDSGLCDALANGGATRPAYTAWGGLPSFA
jgi:hypothetical protein